MKGIIRTKDGRIYAKYYTVKSIFGEMIHTDFGNGAGYSFSTEANAYDFECWLKMNEMHKEEQ